MKLGVAHPRTWNEDRGIGRMNRWMVAVGLLGLIGCSELPPSMTGKVPVDCMGLIDLDKDNVAGKWTKDDSGNLKTTTSPFGRCQVPYIPGEEYDVKVAAQRSNGTDGLVIGLVKGANQFAVVVDGATKAIGTGIDQLDKKSFVDNELACKKTFFADKVVNITIQVRNTSFVINVDGNDVLTWKDKEKVKDKDGKETEKETGKPIDYGRCTLIPNWKNPLGKCIFIGAFSEFTISSFQVINQKGGGKYLR
ncbi:MAG TPA: hypothetical protein VEN81_02600 [Planctomycetota bacterium]|nr:hypothetical protein [Planctomycetota bacterium]